MYKTYVLSKEETEWFSQLIELKCDKVILSKEKDSYYVAIFSSMDTMLKINKKIVSKLMK